jgi:hypothetical protein
VTIEEVISLKKVGSRFSDARDRNVPYSDEKLYIRPKTLALEIGLTGSGLLPIVRWKSP